MIKLIVAGSRTLRDYNFIKKHLDKLLQNVDDEIIIISGKAQGADKLGECVVFWNGVSPGSESMIRYAKQYDLNLRYKGIV